ncbi:MAG: NADH-quinone oxidoreductase subunit NuoK [candidate division KSB1 bacterium]|nr:NADH-quinone oxidoreductase subunit NuoK [candidate division KSB1 bacterium]MDQ7063224.1 NADH-quinone oxidoreductase subunit NuoK [candidate division KSB1 bacterium]
MMAVGLNHFLVLSALLFVLGLLAVLTKKNAVTVLMGIELILNAANINFIAFSRYADTDLDGQLFALFVIITAAAGAAVALAIVLNIYKQMRSVNLDEADTLAG